MTWVDKKEIEPNNNDSQHFPSEGLYIGALSNGASTFPALLFLKEVDGCACSTIMLKARTM